MWMLRSRNKRKGYPKILVEHGDLKKFESAAYGTLSCFDVILFEVIEFFCLTSYLKKRHPEPGYEIILKRRKEQQYHRHSILKKTNRKQKHERNLFQRGNLHEAIVSKW